MDSLHCTKYTAGVSVGHLISSSVGVFRQNFLMETSVSNRQQDDVNCSNCDPPSNAKACP